MSHLTYPEAVVVGALQGVTELFPVSSLGHSVILPALVGGRWARDLNVSTPESPYLAFIVGLHVATALALLAFFWRDWLRIVGGLLTSVRARRVETPDERLAWMVVLATIPVGVTGLLLEHTFRTVLGRPVPAAVFLAVNGVLLFGTERLRRRTAVRSGRPALVGASAPVGVAGDGAPDGDGPGGDDQRGADLASDHRIAAGTLAGAVLVGSAQVLALLPGISRAGVTMGAGLLKGLSHEDAARFSFLLATPVIFAAGVLKLPDLFGPLGAGIRGQVLVGSLAAGIAAYLSVRFLVRYFQTRTLTPFAGYCAVAGVCSLVWLTAGGTPQAVAATAGGRANRPDHVVVAVFENKDYRHVKDNPKAPYLNALLGRAATFTNAHAETHPSQPNYLALFSGSTQGVTDDHCLGRFHHTPNLGGQLLAAGDRFTGYAEDLPAPGYLGCRHGDYAAKHNPWVDFDDVPASANQPYTAWPADPGRLPTVAFVVPNLCHDMHDCGTAAGDAWARAHLDPYLRWADTHNSVLVITFDENDGTPGNQILMLVAGAGVTPRVHTEAVNHYTLLRTIEDWYGLPPIGEAANATPISR